MENRYDILIKDLKNILEISNKIREYRKEDEKRACELLDELDMTLQDIIENHNLENFVNMQKGKKRDRFNVLIVEDDEASSIIISKMVKSYLEDIGFLEKSTIETVYNGRDAVEEISKNPYDIVFMDVIMPVMDGFEATKTIRTNPLIKQPLIIIVTSLNDNEDLKRGFECGANWYITKPYDKNELEMILNDIVAGKLYITKSGSTYALDAQETSKNKNDDEAKEELNKNSSGDEIEDEFLDDDFFDFDENSNSSLDDKEGDEDDDFFDFDSEDVDDNINTMHYEEHQKISAEEFMDKKLIDSFDIDDLMELFEDYENISHTANEEYFEQLMMILDRFTRIFNKTYEFEGLSYGFENLKQSLKEKDLSSLDQNTLEIYKELLDNIIQDLQTWTNNVLINKSAIDIHYLDASLLANVAQIDIMLKM